MGVLVGKRDYILDTEELRAWIRILEEPAGYGDAEKEPSHCELEDGPFRGEAGSQAVVSNELWSETVNQTGPGGLQEPNSVRPPESVRFIQPDNLALKLGKSVKWVYQHGTELGGKRIGGSWFFTEEGLEHAILGQIEKTVARAGQMERGAPSGRLRYKEGRRGLGIRKAKATGKGGTDCDADRHGLGDFV